VNRQLHQIGNLEEVPDEEPFASAYQAALEGEIALIAYDGEETDGLGTLQ